MDKAVGDELQTVVNKNLNDLLAKLPTSLHVGQGPLDCDINIGFSEVAATPDYLSLGMPMLITNNATKAACGIASVALPYMDTSTSKPHVLVLSMTFVCSPHS